jgi:hypothetical protein
MIRRLLLFAAGLVLLSAGYLLGSLSSGVTQAGPTGQASNCQTFRETGKTVCGRFLRYWLENGGLAQQGFPISGEFPEKSDLNGQTYTVQYFERAVFEAHPENQPPYDVLLSQLGTFRYRQKYPSGGPAPAPTSTSAPQPPARVEVGEPVRRNGLVFTLIRADFPPKRVDVIYQIRNETGGPINFTIANADQRLVDNTEHEYTKADPGRVSNVTLSNGQVYEGGTSFNADLTGKGVKALTFAIDNLPRIGSVRVNIPTIESPR